jgi:hypothetical protein
VQDQGFRVSGLGFRIRGSGFGVRCGVYVSEIRIGG